MQTIKIKTVQNIDIDYEVAGLGERMVGRVIDYSLYIAVYFIYYWIAGNVTHKSVLMNFTLPEILYFTFYAFYDIVAETFFNGQSLGKFIMKIKVISIDGGRPSFGQYLLRYIFRMVDFVFTIGAGAILSIALTEKNQRIGDVIAGTTLIKTKSAKQFQDLEAIDIEETYQPVFFEATNLSDHDIALITEVMAHFYKTADITLVNNIAKKVQVLLHLNPPEDGNNYKFLKTLLKDYNHLSVKTNIQLT